MKIQNLNIDVSQMPTAATARRFTVNGIIGSEFKMIVLQNPSSSSSQTAYYNFRSKSFDAGHNSMHNDLIVKLSSSSYSDIISFPSGGGDYVIKLLPINQTEIFNSNSNIITKNISKQSANATLTFKPGTADTSYYQTLPSVTSTGAINDTATANINFSVLNSTTDAKSYGFSITSSSLTTYNEKFWYYETTEDVVTNRAGDGADTTSIIVDDTSEIVAGMELKYYKSTTAPENNAGSAVGYTTVRSVNSETGGITFTQAVGFDEGQTMTFRAYGVDLIQGSIDTRLELGDSTLAPTVLTKTVEARGGVTETTDGSSANIALPNTLGIGGGNNFSYTGVGVNNTSSNNVTSVTADADGSGNDGLIVVQLAQVLTAGTVLTFLNTFAQINVEGSITISKYPSANKTIYFDLDKVLTLGSAS